jgi:hypothetical protein
MYVIIKREPEPLVESGVQGDLHVQVCILEEVWTVMIYSLTRFVRTHGARLFQFRKPAIFRQPQRPLIHGIPQQVRGMKRKVSTSPEPTARKAPKVGDYCFQQPVCNQNGNPIWPAPEAQLALARDFLKEW